MYDEASGVTLSATVLYKLMCCENVMQIYLVQPRKTSLHIKEIFTCVSGRTGRPIRGCLGCEGEKAGQKAVATNITKTTVQNWLGPWITAVIIKGLGLCMAFYSGTWLFAAQFKV